MGIGLGAHYFHGTTPELPRIYTFVPRNYTKAATDLHFIATELHFIATELHQNCHGLPRNYTKAATNLHFSFAIFDDYCHGSTPMLSNQQGPLEDSISTDLHL